MKRSLLSTAALATLSAIAILAAATQPAVAATQPSSPNQTEEAITQPDCKQHSPNQMSIRVAGYEVLLEAKETTPRAIKNGSGYYGGRIGSFEIGFNGFRELAGAYDLYPESEKGFMDLRMGKSIHFTFNVWTFSTTLTRNNTLGVTGAIGLTANNYAFETASTYIVDGKLLRPVDPGHNLKKSKLNTFAIHFPLALEVNPTRNFFFSVGGYVDLVTGGHMKWKSPKDKLRDLSPNFLQAGLTARIGFRHAYLFGSYDFVEIFKDGRGPALNPYTFGLGFGF